MICTINLLLTIILVIERNNDYILHPWYLDLGIMHSWKFTLTPTRCTLSTSIETLLPSQPTFSHFLSSLSLLHALMLLFPSYVSSHFFPFLHSPHFYVISFFLHVFSHPLLFISLLQTKMFCIYNHWKNSKGKKPINYRLPCL